MPLLSSPALCPQDSAWRVQETPEAGSRAAGLPTAPLQVRWGFRFSLRATLFPNVSSLSLSIPIHVVSQFTTAGWGREGSVRSLSLPEQTGRMPFSRSQSLTVSQLVPSPEPGCAVGCFGG